MRSTPIPAAALRDRLTAAGFRLVPGERGEEVYVRAHDRDPRYAIYVYSSIQRSDKGQSGRDADTVRIVALHMPHSDSGHTIFRATRIHRSGAIEAVLDRVIERIREAYAAISSHRREIGNATHGAARCRPT